MELCRLENIHMDYGDKPVLYGAELGISRGAIWGLVGDNGSGKSTLLKILAGILRPKQGRLHVPYGKPRIGYMPENCQWYPYLTGAQVLRYFARYTNADHQTQKETLDRVGLWAVRDKKIAAYSKGMKQKLGLAQAIVGQPDLLVLDEPTNGLDPRGIADFYQILHERVKAGATVVLSSHLLAELDGHISHIALLREGRITASAPCETLMRQAGLPCRVTLRPVLQHLAQSAIACLERTIRDQGWSLRQTEDIWEVALPDDQLQDLLRLLGAMECKLKDIQIHQPTLNDLYLHTFSSSFDGYPVPSAKENQQPLNGHLHPSPNSQFHSSNNQHQHTANHGGSQ